MIIGCKPIAQKYKDMAKAKINCMWNEKIIPCLYIVQVGDNLASHAYIRGKLKDSEEVGIHAELIKLPENATEGQIQKEIDDCQDTYMVDGFKYVCSGIILQLPVPEHINVKNIKIPDWADVDGFNKNSEFYPCTPLGVMKIFDSINYNLDGKNVLIFGQSDIVGKPMVDMLLKRHCNVFSVNSTIETYTKEELILRSDVIITAVGRMDFLTPNMIDGKWSSKISGYENTGSCPELIIDVGINYGSDGKQYGDVSEELRSDKYNHCFDITPRIGGVGLMTRAMLMCNTAHVFTK
jgi:methylenetetrahydrofolate dehydrogenase (NADP+) / methenyltetrahydrofolate cyclohydrolase